MMVSFLRPCAVMLALVLAPATLLAQQAQQTLDVPPSGESARSWPFGQQHGIAVNLSIFQPTVLRLEVPVYHQEKCTWLAELYGGSEFFDGMAGGGIRVQFTAGANAERGDAFLIGPGLGLHVLPGHGSVFGGLVDGGFERTTVRTYLAGDVDFSWLHEFSSHFAYEIGIKLGLAGRLEGNSPDYQRFLMFSKDFFPIINVFSGFRF
jgi:hypothetical protein